MITRNMRAIGFRLDGKRKRWALIRLKKVIEKSER